MKKKYLFSAAFLTLGFASFLRSDNLFSLDVSDLLGSSDPTVYVSSIADVLQVQDTPEDLLMQVGDNGVKTVSGSLIFYDDGGADGKYTKGQNSTITFVPANPSNVIKLVFQSFYTYSNDNFNISQGSQALTTPTAKYYGNKNSALPAPFISKAADGAVTINFKSLSTSTAQAGWKIEVSEYTPAPLTLTDVAVTPLPAVVFKGGTQPVLDVSLTVSGDKGVLNLEQFCFDACASTPGAIASASLLMTDTISNYGVGSLYGAAQTNAPYTFTASKTIQEAGTYHFWLTYEVAATAQADNLLEAALSSVRCDGKEIALPSTDKVTVSVRQGMHGNYRIGSSSEANYATPQAAIDALKEGIDGPVVLEMESGNYSGQLIIPEIPGTSSVNTVTLKSLTGNYSDVIFATQEYSSEPDGMIAVKGADYFTLEGITFTTEAAWPSLINIKNVSRHVTVRNCYLKAATYCGYSGGTKLIYMEPINCSNMNNDYVTVENNLLEGGTYGVYVNGTGYLALQKQVGATIAHNQFNEQGCVAIYVTQENEALVENNLIENTLSTYSNFKAIDLVTMPGTIVRNNSITLATQSYASGIYLRKRPTNVTTEQRTRIYNNEIIFADLKGSSLSYGINCTDELAYTDLVYNSILMNRKAGTGNGAGAYFYGTATKVPVEVQVQNNIIQNMTGGVTFRVYHAALFGPHALTFSKNVLYTTGEIFAYTGSNLADLEAWQTASGDMTSVVKPISFVSPYLLLPASAEELTFANPLTFVTTDIKGNARSAEAPVVGAYESTGISSLPALLGGYPQVEGVSHEVFTFKVKADQDANLFYLVQKTSEAAPTQAEVIAAQHAVFVRQAIEKLVPITGLSSTTEYKVYYVLQNMGGQSTQVFTSETYETSFLPTAVSDFEQVVPDQTGFFEDGTASFKGFIVEPILDGVGEHNTQAAKIAGDAVITLTNSTKGLVLNGFYVKAQSTVLVQLYQGEEKRGEFVIPATSDWKFINLRNRGALTQVRLSSAGECWIDNFSGEPQPLQVAVTDVDSKEGETASLLSSVEGGAEPYTYIWKNARMETVSTDANYRFTAQHTAAFTLIVTDAWGTQQQVEGLIQVSGHSYAGTFEDLYLEPESHWGGKNVPGESTINTLFYTGSYALNNTYMPDWDSWAFWGYSNETSTDYASLKDQFRSAAGSGVDGSANYGVAYVSNYMGTTSLQVMHAVAGDTIQGCYVTNTAWVKDAILNGDGMSTVPGGFAKGDSLTLIVIGKNGNLETGRVHFQLADYRGENPDNYYYLKSWQWMDLRALGKVTELNFEMAGSKSNSWGLSTPNFVCMDNINGARKEKVMERVTIGLGRAVRSLDSYFQEFTNAFADITYQLADAYDEQVVKVSSITEDLELEGLQPGTTDLVIKATQCGQQLFVRIPITVSTQVSLAEAQQEIARIRSEHASLHVTTSQSDYALELITPAGESVRLGSHYEGCVRVDLSNFKSGIYLVKMTTSEGRSVVQKIYCK